MIHMCTSIPSWGYPVYICQLSSVVPGLLEVWVAAGSGLVLLQLLKKELRSKSVYVLLCSLLYKLSITTFGQLPAV